MLTANEARTAIVTARCAVVYFTKANGERRRMVCHVPALDDSRALTRKANHLLVWDVEKGDVRTVNLSTVESVRPVKTSTPGKAADRPALPPKHPSARSLTMEKISALFDNRAF